MLKKSTHDNITIFLMGKSIAGRLLYPVHAFLLDDLLIDTGTTSAEKELLSELKGHSELRIVNTHSHEDHIGNNRILQEKYNAKIFAHKHAIPVISDPRKLNLKFYQRIVWDMPGPSEAQLVNGNIRTKSYNLEIIPSPGHSEDHICLYEHDKKWMFTGDLFCGTKFIYLREDEDFNTTLATLKALSQWDCGTIFCSLKGVVKNGNEALLKKIAGMQNIKDRVEELAQKGVKPFKIKKIVLGREGSMTFATNGHYSKQNTVDSIIWNMAPKKIGN